jgi:hypothetical protein
MMQINTDMCNMALAHISDSIELADAETDRTKAGRTCRQFYPNALEECIRDFPWPKFTVTEALALIENPSTEWTYAYRRPAKCMFFRRILSGDRNDSSSYVAYDVVRDDAGEIILTDQQYAIGEWSVLIDDPTKWDADFRMAFTLLLASYIAPKVTGGDKFKLGDKALQKYSAWISKARNNARNEIKRDRTLESGFTRARR